MTRRLLLHAVALAGAVALLVTSIGLAAVRECERTRPMPPIASIVEAADAIVVARVAGWEAPPAGSRFEHGDPSVTVRLTVTEVVKGVGLPSEFALPGYLEESDDFNEGPVPYGRVRPGGHPPACFAANYRVDRPYLLLLDQVGSGWAIHPEIAAPVNEQLRVPHREDPWFEWVKAQLNER